MMKLFTWQAPQNTDPFAQYTFGIYRFNDYSDSSGKGHNLNSGANNSISANGGIYYGALNVPASSTAVGVTSPGFDMSGNFTMEGWVNLSTYAVSGSTAITNTVFGTRLQTTAGFDVAITNRGGTLQATIGTGASGSVSPTGTISGGLALGSWHHIAAVRSGSTVSLYVDGTRVATGSNSVNYGSPAVSMGALNFTATSPTSQRPLQGLLSDVRLTTAARYLANFTPPAGY